MSLTRQIRRHMERDNHKNLRRRAKCRKCKGKMVHKVGYGWVCPECGWKQNGV